MLKYIVVLAIFGTGTVFGEVKIQRNLMGSGIQNELMTADVATPVGDYGVYHAPQYMPGFPTAATIWPRVIEVKCQNDLCAGYENTPALGRGEYLFFKPVNTVAAASIPIASPTPIMEPTREIHKKIKE
ncbi:hypothetical protein [Polaromonas sp. DSR2-3-2]|uniref:hypothetical protein n=1 Tax=unclassified Polaromonas TaxID=2638319 RepID=UPI003CE8EA20